MAREPVGICTICGKYAYSFNQLNNQCSERNQDDGKWCRGVYGSALNKDDWDECDICHGENQSCECCEGTGLIFVRPH